MAAVDLKTGSVSGYFPLHDYPEKNVLSAHWLYRPAHFTVAELERALLPWRQPLSEVKEYFGEKVSNACRVGRCGCVLTDSAAV